MSDFNTKLDEIIGLLNARMPQPKTINEAKSRVAMCHEAKQAITSLTKELVAEAKPEPTKYEKYNSDCLEGFNIATNEFERNILKALEEL